jgi:hypothetical protein
MSRKLLPLLLVLIALPAAASVDYFLSVNSPFVTYDPGARARITAFVVPVCCRVNDPTQATVTIPLPPGSTNISAPGEFGGWTCDVNGSAVTCTTFLAATPPYPGIVVDFNVPPSIDGTAFSGKATLATTVTDDNPANNVSDVRVSVYRIMQVTTADDFGAGSLRETIGRANAECAGIACKMTFAGPMTIEPLSPLPAITACNLLIDGGIASATSLDVPRPVEISGAKSTFANGLEIRSYCGVTLRGLTVNGFGANGIVLAAPAAPRDTAQQLLTVESCFIGTDSTASEARPNGMRGIAVETPFTDAAISNCTVSGNRYSGVAVWASSSVRIGGRIGVGRGGKALGNGASGIYIDGGVAQISFGPIAYNHDFGVGVGPHASHVTVQPEGVFANRVQDIDWGLDGPTLTDRSGRMPPAPVLLDAVYDAAKDLTIVSGVLPGEGRKSGLNSVRLFQRTPTATIALFPQTNLSVGPGSDAPFTMSIRGDLRSVSIAGQTAWAQFPDSFPLDTSELSAAIVVH